MSSLIVHPLATVVEVDYYRNWTTKVQTPTKWKFASAVQPSVQVWLSLLLAMMQRVELTLKQKCDRHEKLVALYLILYPPIQITL